MRIDIPNRRPTSFVCHGAFDLICGRCYAPPETFGELPALVLGGQGKLVACWERRVVERGWRD